MESALKITNVGRATRSKAKIKIRQPLREIFTSGISTDISDGVIELIKDELNVKAVKSAEGLVFTQLAAKPNFRTLGRKFGKYINVGKEIILNLDQDMLKKVEAGENISIDIEGVEHELSPDDLILEHIDDPHYVNVTENDITISICNEIDEDMLTEGLSRELINRIQNSRKNAGFEVIDRIYLAIEAPDHIIEAATKLKDNILSEILGENMSFEKPDNCEYSEKWNINGSKVMIHLSRINN
jgi:isoleucyl-tRNA synthetase